MKRPVVGVVVPAKGAPYGEPTTKTQALPPKRAALAALKRLSPEERLEVLRAFCRGCGEHFPEGNWCRCWDDS